MKGPVTEAEILAFHNLQREDPRKALDVASQWIEDNPKDSSAFFNRHYSWLDLGEPARALEDLDKAIELQPKAISFWSRGDVYRSLGDYEKAMQDYKRGEAIDPAAWERDAIPLFYQADVYARLGDEANALDCCARLPDHFWTPGHNDLPPGNKAEIAAELRRRAAMARAATSPRTPPARS
jgi:tetratricopeptide (TPR) repeat protein